MSRRRLLVLIAALFVGAVATGIAVAKEKDGGNENEFRYAIGLWGDMPYSDVQAQTGVPNLIADMNNADIAFSVHDGDLKAGKGSKTSATPTTCAFPSSARASAASRAAISSVRPTKRDKPRKREISSGVWSAPTPSNS